MHKLPYSLSIKIFRLISQPVAQNTFDFILTFKLSASRELFQGTKQVKVWRGKVWAVRGIREQFPFEVVDGLHRLGCCVRPCIFMMQDDSFWLMTPAFVLYVFFDLFQRFTAVGTVLKASQEIKLWWLGLAYTADLLLWISTALHPSATKNLITDRSSILEHDFLSDIFVYYQSS